MQRAATRFRISKSAIDRWTDGWMPAYVLARHTSLDRAMGSASSRFFSHSRRGPLSSRGKRQLDCNYQRRDGAWSNERSARRSLACAMHRIVVINDRVRNRYPPTRRWRPLDYDCIIVVTLARLDTVSTIIAIGLHSACKRCTVHTRVHRRMHR